MSLLPANAECPRCFKYDGWVGAKLKPHLRCTCADWSRADAINDRDLRFTVELQKRNLDDQA